MAIHPSTHLAKMETILANIKGYHTLLRNSNYFTDEINHSINKRFIKIIALLEASRAELTPDIRALIHTMLDLLKIIEQELEAKKRPAHRPDFTNLSFVNLLHYQAGSITGPYCNQLPPQLERLKELTANIKKSVDDQTKLEFPELPPQERSNVIHQLDQRYLEAEWNVQQRSLQQAMESSLVIIECLQKLNKKGIQTDLGMTADWLTINLTQIGWLLSIEPLLKDIHANENEITRILYCLSTAHFFSLDRDAPLTDQNSQILYFLTDHCPFDRWISPKQTGKISNVSQLSSLITGILSPLARELHRQAACTLQLEQISGLTKHIPNLTSENLSEQATCTLQLKQTNEYENILPMLTQCHEIAKKLPVINDSFMGETLISQVNIFKHVIDTISLTGAFDMGETMSELLDRILPNAKHILAEMEKEINRLAEYSSDTKIKMIFDKTSNQSGLVATVSDTLKILQKQDALATTLMFFRLSTESDENTPDTERNQTSRKRIDIECLELLRHTFLPIAEREDLPPFPQAMR